MLGHVGPMACSEKEAFEGWLPSGPLLRGFLSCVVPQGLGYFLQSFKIIAISAACLLEGQLSMEQGKKRSSLLANTGRACSCLI